MNHETAYVYGLVDPRDQKIHYVGHTVNMAQRLDGHLSDTSDTTKTAWIAELKKQNLSPQMIEIARVPYEDRHNQEYKWIYLGRATGWPLTNTSAMKTEKYTGLSDELQKTLVVEVEKGLTWRWVKYQIEDDRAWIMARYNLLLMASIGFTVALILFGLAVFTLGDLAAHYATVIVWLSIIFLLLIVTGFIYRKVKP